MSETSTPLDSLFETQRTLIDRTIETQERINRQGLDLTREAVRPLVGVAPGDDEDAEEQLEDAFEQLEDAQAELFEDIQGAAERGVDTSEDVTGWSVDLFEGSFERLREVGEDVEAEIEEAAEELEEDLEEAAETVEEEVEETADEVVETAEDAVESAETTAEEFLEELEGDVDATVEEFEEFRSTLESEFEFVDDASIEGLVESGIGTLSELAEAETEAVADAIDATEAEAEEVLDLAVETEGESVSELEGIGKTYSDRLADAGIRTQGELAQSSAEAVADAAGVSEDRAAEWVQRAQGGT